MKIAFQGQLRPDQEAAWKRLAAHDIGVLCATTAFGKTVLAAYAIAQRGVNTLVLVHRTQLMDQWMECLSSFLDLKASAMGRLGGGRRSLKGVVDIALLQSISRNGVVDDRIADYGQIIVDECHHVSARAMELALRRAKARYILGLTATVTRKDGHHPIIFMQCGPLRYRVEAASHEGTRSIARQVIVRPTGFQPVREMPSDVRAGFVELMDLLIEDEIRNEKICGDIAACVAAGAAPLVITERTRHVDRIADRLRKKGLDVCTFVGGMTKADLKNSSEMLRREGGTERPVMVATGRFVGEGFDEPRLDTLFLTMPISWRGLLTQYVGRLHRIREGKGAVTVYDYCDMHVGMLSKMFERRRRVYEKLGYSVLMAASILPGWPLNVALPYDPTWKEKYAASVRRLVRDGVDDPLARLFVAAAPFVELGEAPDEPRARSAAEAFLFRRLESLPRTAGRFKLNARLAIPFCGFPEMEVDFWCPDAALVVEVDGFHHFASPEAYRRDRRKDLLLQENRMRVLRFLAADISERLDSVLDDILRVLG